jgi:hypothetical protein
MLLITGTGRWSDSDLTNPLHWLWFFFIFLILPALMKAYPRFFNWIGTIMLVLIAAMSIYSWWNWLQTR